MEYEKLADREGHFLFKQYTKDYYPKNNVIPTFHNSIEIIFVESGEFDVYIDGRWKCFEGGSIIYVDRLTPHSTRVTNPTEELSVYVLVITQPYLSVISDEADMTFDNLLQKNEKYSDILSFVKWGYGLFGEMNDEMKSGFATMLFGMLKRYYPMHKKSSDSQNKLLFGIMEYISNSYAEKLTLELLAQRFGYEKTYISKTFNRFLGMNLREYINRYRITVVNSLKKQNPDKSLWELAERCGFESLNTFYRAYKKYK